MTAVEDQIKKILSESISHKRMVSRGKMKGGREGGGRGEERGRRSGGNRGRLYCACRETHRVTGIC